MSQSRANATFAQLLGEGTLVFRPSPAEFLGPDTARLIQPPGYDPEDEDWEFEPGSVVRVERRQLSGGEAFVAVALVS